MASSTANDATAVRIVAIQITSKPRRVGPAGTGSMVVSPLSNLEVDHFGHDEHADTHPHQPDQAGDHQPLVDEEGPQVMWIDEPDEREHDERQRADDPRRSLGFRAHRADLE